MVRPSVHVKKKGSQLSKLHHQNSPTLPSLVPRPTPQGGRVWEITLLGAVQLECHVFWIQQNSSFRSSTRLVLYYSNFQNFYVLPYICFLSLVELERWLARLTFFSPHQHMWQHSDRQDTSGHSYFPRIFHFHVTFCNWMQAFFYKTKFWVKWRTRSQLTFRVLGEIRLQISDCVLQLIQSFGNSSVVHALVTAG